MDAKEYLQGLADFSSRINHEAVRLKRLKETLGSLRSPSFEPNYNTPSFGDSYHARMTTEIMDKELQLKAAREELKQWRNDVQTLLMEMENTDYQLVLGLRYLDGMDWPKISTYLNTSLSTVKRWHLKALDAFPTPDQTPAYVQSLFA